ncbi:MAG TPA: aminomethyltransferase family protein, partial [Acidobacteriota bacterium]|nr:aminomethyltransferase family protein [Acidobacteriota bacterium]
MPDPTPFYPRTSQLCKSMQWRYWSGYFVPSSYEVHHDVEYYAIRNSAALIDITPLFKYDIKGPDAARLMDRVVTKDVKKCAVGQVLYSTWCDEDGHTMQDGTVFRISQDYFRMNAADPTYRWLQINAQGMDVKIEDVTHQYAALALQGPLSRDILRQLIHGSIDQLKFFRLAADFIENIPIIVSRTGYTGDLGYEIWLPTENAVQLYDILLEAGKPYGITPAGNLALDISRVEAGFILIEVDYISAEKAVIASQRYSPFEIGLGWTVSLDKENFVGKKKLVEEKKRGSARQLIGLDIRWDELERVYQEDGLPPQLPSAAWRGGIPLYAGEQQVGKATSGCWSPVLKKYIALGTVEAAYSKPGTIL